MTDAPLVKINTDPPEKIAELYGIGLAHAMQIVRHREQIAPFKTPDDLARVEGIGLDLAITLAPHINWEFTLSLEYPEERDWFSILAGLALILFFTYFATKITFPNLTTSLQEYSNTTFAWTNVWADISKLALTACIILIATFWLSSGLTTTPSRRKNFLRIMFIIAMFAILFVISTLLARIIKYQFYNPGGWTDYFSEPSHLVAFIMFPILLLSVGPILLVIFWPNLRASPKLARIDDISWIISAPFLAFAIWAERNFFPISYLFFMGFIGVFLGYAGLQILRTGESYFTSMTSYILDQKILRQIIIATDSWQAWINARLPDPEQQKALKKALEESYPTSKWRTWSGAIVLGAGGWIILTVLSAIAQWIVEKGLNKLWP